MAVWTATTLTGMAISWAGVGGAMRGTVAATPDLAAEVPVLQGRPPASGPSSGPSGEPSASASASASDSSSPSASPSRSGSGGSPAATPGYGRSPSPEASRKPGEKVRTYTVESGRVVLALSDESARLVSATPDNGFRAKVWRQPQWLRVDLTDDVHGSAVFATWHDGAVRVQVYEY